MPNGYKGKSLSGGARLKRKGQSLIWVPVTDYQKKMIRTAAANENKPMSQFLLDHALKAAKESIEDIKMFHR